MKFKFLFLLLLHLVFIVTAKAQLSNSLLSSSFVVGEKSPDFRLEKVNYYPSSSFSLSGNKGKWILLSFFGIGCSSSFEQLKAIDSMQRTMADTLQTMLIGKAIEKYGDDTRRLREEYEQYKKQYDLILPVAYDSAIFKQLGIRTTPYSVLIDPKRIVRAVFSINTASVAGVRAFIEGHINEIPGDYRRIQMKMSNFDWNVPLLINNNGGNEEDYKFRSIFTDELPIAGPNPICISSMYGNETEMINLTIKELLLFAYSDTIGRNPNFQPNSYSTYFSEPVFDFPLSEADSLNFFVRKYCYSQIVPKENSNALFMQQVMRDNLKNYVGLVATIEKRKMPVYHLISVGDTSRLVSKGGVPLDYDRIHGHVKFKNVPTKEIIKVLWGRYRPSIPILDRTGIKGNIDMLLTTIRTQPLEDAIRSLNKNGLDLIKTTSEMQVVVVSKVR